MRVLSYYSIFVLLVSAAMAQGGPLPPPPGPPPLEPLQPPIAPPGNPITPAKINLGKALFWDEQLSSTRTVSCGTCHVVDAGGSDPRSVRGSLLSTHPGLDGLFGTPDDVTGSPGVPLSSANGDYVSDAIFGVGVQVTGRKSPTVIDAAYAPRLFWDGRAGPRFRDPLTGQQLLSGGAALESQAVAPPIGDSEMAHLGRDWNDVAQRVAAARPLALSPAVPTALGAWIDCRAYPDLFADAFGTPAVTPARILMAIATYERTLVSTQTPLDQALSGGPPLAAAEQRGMGVFLGSGCAACHRGNRFTDDQFHNIGEAPIQRDIGRQAVTGDPRDAGAFKTPSLRSVELRAPYMHDGRFATLVQVVDFYDRGGDFASPNKDPRIVPLGLSAQQKADLVAFLGRPLTDPRIVAGAPPFDRPLLYTESSLVPALVQPAAAGASGARPHMIALEPALSGNPSFTVAVDRAPGGASALLVIDSQPLGPTPPSGAVFFSAPVTLAGVGTGNGHGSVSVQIPPDPALVGTRLFGRWYINDGGLALSEVFAADVVRPSCGASTSCGDCDGDGVAPTILDALAAALLGVGLRVPSGGMAMRCDVDSSGNIDVIDALNMSRAATGLTATMGCP